MRKFLQKTFHKTRETMRETMCKTAKKARHFFTQRRLKNALHKEQRKEQRKERIEKIRSSQSGAIPTHYDRALIEWEAPEYGHYEKGKIWYIIFALTTALFTTYAILNKDYIFATAIILFALTYTLIQRKKPQTTKIIISHNGIKVEKEAYSFHQIHAFWIIYQPPYIQTLNIRTNKHFMPDITISLEDQDPAIIRHVLSHFIPEWQNRQEAFSETLIRLLRL